MDQQSKVSIAAAMDLNASRASSSRSAEASVLQINETSSPPERSGFFDLPLTELPLLVHCNSRVEPMGPFSLFLVPQAGPGHARADSGTRTATKPAASSNSLPPGPAIPDPTPPRGALYVDR